MEVNIKAVSDALDSLLVEEEWNGRGSQPKRTSAIVPRRRQPILKPPSTASPLTAGFLESRSRIAEAAPNSQVANKPSASKAQIDSSPQQKEADAYTEKANSVSRLRSATLNDSNSPSLSSRKESLARRTTDSAHKERNSRRTADKTLGVVDGLASYEKLRSVEILAAKPLEASGLGISSAFITSRNVAKRVDKVQLSSKSWVTNTTLTPYAHALFELESFEASVQAHTRTSPYDENSSSGNSHRVHYQDVTLLLHLDTRSDRERRTPADELLYDVTVEASSSRRRGFILLSEALSVTDGVSFLTIPGGLLNHFIRVSVKSAEGMCEDKLIRVRALCLFWSDTWSSKKIEQDPLKSSLEDEVEAAIQKYNTEDKSRFLSHQAPESTEAVLTSRPAASPQYSPSKVGELQTDSGETVPEPLCSSPSDSRNVADFVRQIALAGLRDVKEETHRKRESSVPTSYVYNWLTDSAELGDLARPGGLRQVRSAQNEEESRPSSPPPVSALAEYIETLQAWNIAPLWSVSRAVDFCMSQTTSFSVSTAPAGALFADDAPVHFVQPFKVHFLVVSSSAAGTEVDISLAPSSAALPPLSSLSVLARQASSCGYAAELLFRCDDGGSFGCVLRPEKDIFQCSEEHCKLVFVVSAEKQQNAHTRDVPGATELLLQTALDLYNQSEKVSLFVRKSASPSFSGGSLEENPPRPLRGVLRMLVDRTGSFERLASILTQWSLMSGPVRYYGNASQSFLRMLLTPWHFAGLADNGFGAEVERGNFKAEAHWCRLHVKAIGLWKSNTLPAGEASEGTIALELQARDSVSFVWQSVARSRATLRLVLTDNHLLESLPLADGLVVSNHAAALVQKFCLCPGKRDAAMPCAAPLSDAPWEELLQSAKALFGVAEGVFEHTTLHTFLALRRRISVSFAFHILSTAFKRGWRSVCASMPDAYIEFEAIASEQTKSGEGHAGVPVFLDGFAHKSVSFIDEDAFMDTFVQWSYPLPRVVTVHCKSVFLPLAEQSPKSGTAAEQANTWSSGGGVATLFSIETLCKFSPVQSLEEAIKE